MRSDLPDNRQMIHKSVLLHQIIEFLDPKPGDLFIDATVGFGGHTKEFLEQGARVLGIDQDPQAIEYLQAKKLKDLTLIKSNFSKIGQIARENGFKKVQGILFDLGVSSHQLDQAQRGFSFRKSGPLDMRMDPDLTIRAYDIVNHFDEGRLYEILKTYGQEKFSRSITRAICSARKIKPILTTTDLASLIQEAVRRRGPQNVKHFGVNKRGVRSRVHAATRTFQALRIVVNSELLNLEDALPQTLDLIKPGGRLAVISFHSLEDAIVKRFFKREKRLKVLTLKPVGPTDLEIKQNPRSRSAKLRVAQKI